MKRHAPPALAQWIIKRVVPISAREEVLEDLREIWQERERDRGLRSANRWYWSQTARTITIRKAETHNNSRRRGPRERMFDSLRRDVGYAVTQVRRHPAIAAVVVLTLSLGIGATTAIFSAVNAVLLAPLPYSAPERLVMVTAETGGSALPRYLSGPDFLDMREGAPSFSEIAGLLETTVGPMTQVDRPAHIRTTPVTWNVFQLLGINVVLGRNFNSDDAIPVPADATDPPPTSAIISHAFWQRSFGGDSTIIGRVVHIWGSATEIVGVLPEGLQLVLPPSLNTPPDGDIWRAIRWDMSTWARDGRWLRAVARLSDGATTQRAQVELDLLAADLRQLHPTLDAEEIRFLVSGLGAATTAPLQGPLWFLMGAVTLVLLIACANVANLLLARGAARAREMAVRVSLGAGRRRLVRQLLTESSVMALLGAGGGVALAAIGVKLLHAIRPADLHHLEGVQLNVAVLGFAVAVAVLASISAGILPAYHTTQQAMSGHLRTRSGSRLAGRSRSMLVIIEVSLSVILLVGAGLLIRTFGKLQTMPLGFEPERVLTVTATQSYRPREERQTYESELLRAASSVPGVTSVGIAFPLPMNGVYERSAEYAIDGRETDPSAWTTAYFRTVSPTYFETMGLRLLAGRQFRNADENYDIPIVILDERLAAREFPGRNPVGRPLWVRGMEGDTLRAEIVGVVEYAPQWDHRDLRPTMYFPRVFYQSHEVSVVAKIAGDATTVGRQLSDAILSVDANFPSDLVPMSQFVQDRLARSRFLLVLMQVFSGLALGLSAVGLYGVLSYSVRQQHKEFGVKIALGALGADVTRGVVWNGVRLALVGVGIGLVGAMALGRGLRSQLFQIGTADPWAIIGAASIVLFVSVLASLIPAVRASRIEPVVALQSEDG